MYGTICAVVWPKPVSYSALQKLADGNDNYKISKQLETSTDDAGPWIS